MLVVLFIFHSYLVFWGWALVILIWGKVLFLQVSVILSIGAVGEGLHPEGSASGGGLHPRVRQTPPPDNTGYGQQEGGTHATGMHFCWAIVWYPCFGLLATSSLGF